MANLIKLSSQPTDNHLTHHRAESQNNNPFLVKKEEDKEWQMSGERKGMGRGMEEIKGEKRTRRTSFSD